MSAISETIALVAPFTGQFAAGRPTTATTTASYSNKRRPLHACLAVAPLFRLLPVPTLLPGLMSWLRRKAIGVRLLRAEARSWGRTC